MYDKGTAVDIYDGGKYTPENLLGHAIVSEQLMVDGVLECYKLVQVQPKDQECSGYIAEWFSDGTLDDVVVLASEIQPFGKGR